jgi:hypothetical protein
MSGLQELQKSEFVQSANQPIGIRKKIRKDTGNKIVFNNDIAIIFLPKNKYAVIDSEDAQRVSVFTWCYAQGRVSARNSTLLSRVIMLGDDLKNNKLIDHINHNTLDNRKCNLRLATKQENNSNRLPQGGTSKFKGVYFNKQHSKWKSQISINCKKVHLGFFDSELEAAIAYDKAAKELHGEFSYTNF